MEQQQGVRAAATETVSPEVHVTGWVAPLQSIETFSISGFTLLGSSPPDDDGLGYWTTS